MDIKIPCWKNNLSSKKNKLFDWIDDHIIWYIYTKPREYYLNLRGWIYYNFNKYHWELIKTAITSYPYDGTYLLVLEEKQIDKVLYYFEHHQSMIDEQYNEILRTLKLAKYCLHILNNEWDLYEYSGETKMIPQKKSEDGKTYINCEEKDAEVYHMDISNHVYHYKGPRVNKHNAYRFIDRNIMECESFKNGTMDHELYVAKCRHLYYLVRERCTDIWWD